MEPINAKDAINFARRYGAEVTPVTLSGPDRSELIGALGAAEGFIEGAMDRGVAPETAKTVLTMLNSAVELILER